MLEYDSAKRPPPAIDEFFQLIRYRDLLFLMVENILKNRYKRSVLGVFWMLLNPLLQTIVLSVAFGTMFKSSLPSYAVYLLAGLLAWNFITQTTQYAMSTMAYGGGLLKRIYIPRATYIIAAVGNGLVNLIVSIGALLVIVIFLHHKITWAWLFLPVSIMILTIFSLGLALLLSTASVFFTDTVDIYQVLIQALFFLTPIMYPPSILPSKLSQLLVFNPFVVLIEIFRIPIHANRLPDFSLVVSAASLALIALVAGWVLFTSKADQLAYRL
ncbi:MAG: ABC transporter permease [Candidatus Contendobacter sp.]|nr:ABC transporter permease [Candidatus Contendobacter sp.]MDG4557569.1 ABC transporter permease [Candidatus Contendobacter sp.]